MDNVCESPHKGRQTKVCVGISTHCVGIGQVPGVGQPAAEVIVGASSEQTKNQGHQNIHDTPTLGSTPISTW